MPGLIHHPNNPHLSPEGLDFVTGIRHCAGCGEERLCNPHETLVPHVASTWRHFLWVTTPQVIARDPVTGHTQEGVIEVPARTVLAQAPLYTALAWCLNCFPHHHPSGCGGCSQAVDTADEHSISEFLAKKPGGHHARFRQVYWHIGCLPKDLNEVRRYRAEIQH